MKTTDLYAPDLSPIEGAPWKDQELKEYCLGAVVDALPPPHGEWSPNRRRSYLERVWRRLIREIFPQAMLGLGISSERIRTIEGGEALRAVLADLKQVAVVVARCAKEVGREDLVTSVCWAGDAFRLGCTIAFNDTSAFRCLGMMVECAARSVEGSGKDPDPLLRQACRIIAEEAS